VLPYLTFPIKDDKEKHDLKIIIMNIKARENLLKKKANYSAKNKKDIESQNKIQEQNPSIILNNELSNSPYIPIVPINLNIPIGIPINDFNQENLNITAFENEIRIQTQNDNDNEKTPKSKFREIIIPAIPREIPNPDYENMQIEPKKVTRGIVVYDPMGIDSKNI